MPCMGMRASAALRGWEIKQRGDALSNGIVKSKWEWLLLGQTGPGTRIWGSKSVPRKLRKSTSETLGFRNTPPASLGRDEFLRSSPAFQKQLWFFIYLFDFKSLPIPDSWCLMPWDWDVLFWPHLLLSPMHFSLALLCPNTCGPRAEDKLCCT